MFDVRITVLKKTEQADLIEEYGMDGLSVCDRFEDNEVIISKHGGRPEGFCEEAWSAVGKYAFALAHGADGFWDSWIPERKIAIVSCNDGLRPVIFRMETVE